MEWRGEWQRILRDLSDWSINQWIFFFKETITRRALFLKDKGENKRIDAQALDEVA